MISLAKQNKTINVISDQIGTPTYAADLANVILKIITAPEWMPGYIPFY